MEKSFIDKIASGELDPHDVVRDLMSYDREYIEDRISNLDLESVIRNNGTIAGLQAANALQSTIKAMRSAFGIPDPLVASVDQMRDTWQKVKSENGFGDSNTMTDEQVMSAVNLLGNALQAAPEPEQAAPEVPDKLKAASKYFDLAAKNGLIKGHYQWTKSNALLAYFCAKISNLLGLGKGTVIDRDSQNGERRQKVSWQPFERLFGVSGLAGSAKDYKRYCDKPTGFEKIDQLFN